MIQITINSEENGIKITTEMKSKGSDAIEEFKTLNHEFPSIRENILKRFPLYVQAMILSDILEESTERGKGEWLYYYYFWYLR